MWKLSFYLIKKNICSVYYFDVIENEMINHFWHIMCLYVYVGGISEIKILRYYSSHFDFGIVIDICNKDFGIVIDISNK